MPSKNFNPFKKDDSMKNDCYRMKSKPFSQLHPYAQGRYSILFKDDEIDMDRQLYAKEVAAKLLPLLTSKEQRFIRLHFGFNDVEGLSLEEIGKLHNISRERTRQIIIKAIHKLRHPSRLKVVA